MIKHCLLFIVTQEFFLPWKSSFHGLNLNPRGLTKIQRWKSHLRIPTPPPLQDNSRWFRQFPKQFRFLGMEFSSTDYRSILVSSNDELVLKEFCYLMRKSLLCWSWRMEVYWLSGKLVFETVATSGILLVITGTPVQNWVYWARLESN